MAFVQRRIFRVPAGAQANRRLDALATAFVFLVSRDEEYVALSARAGSRTFNLGDGFYNYLLLTLARRRLADAAERLDDTACGWVSQEELDHDPTMAPTHINIGVFRMRERLRGFGVDANAIVERRRTARQLRIGTSHLSVVHV